MKRITKNLQKVIISSFCCLLLLMNVTVYGEDFNLNNEITETTETVEEKSDELQQDNGEQIEEVDEGNSEEELKEYGENNSFLPEINENLQENISDESEELAFNEEDMNFSIQSEEIPVVNEGVVFEHDIIYNRTFEAPEINITGINGIDVKRQWHNSYTKLSSVMYFPRNSDFENIVIDVDYGNVGRVNGKNVKLKLTISEIVTTDNFGSGGNSLSGDIEVWIGHNPQTGYLFNNGVYVAKIKYDIRYEDGGLLENPILVLGSLNGDRREATKPINAIKISKTEDSIMYKTNLKTNRSVDADPSSYPEGFVEGWFYDTIALCESGRYIDCGDDWIMNPLTGIKNAYNPRIALALYFEDSSDMEVYMSAWNGSVWQNALIIAREPTYDLTVKKETNISDDDTDFNFKAKIWREIETEEYVFNENDEEVIGQAYAVYDDSNKSLTFFRDEFGKHINGEVSGRKTYFTDFEDDRYINVAGNNNTGGGVLPYVPWTEVRNNVKSIIFEDIIVPVDVDYWFSMMTNLTNVVNTFNLRFHKVVEARGMFSGCTNLENIDTSSWYSSSLRVFGGMFMNCKKLKYLDLSNFDLNQFYVNSEARYGNGHTGFANLFYGCSNLSVEIFIPNLPYINSNVFTGAATAAGSKIKFTTYAMSQTEINKLISEAGRNSHIEFAGYVDELPRYIPDYINVDEQLEYRKEYQIFNLLDDDRFTYDLENQEYTFTVKAGESFVIPDIPKGYNYKITEINIPDGYELISKTNDEGVIEDDITSIFRNKKPQPKEVVVTKVWSGPEEKIPESLNVWIETENGEIYTEPISVTKNAAREWEYVFEIDDNEDCVSKIYEDEIDDFYETNQSIDSSGNYGTIYNRYKYMEFNIAVYTSEQYNQHEHVYGRHDGVENMLHDVNDSHPNKFNIYDSEMKLIKTVEADKDVSFELEDSSDGECLVYYIQQASAPEGYKYGDEIVEVWTCGDGDVRSITEISDNYVGMFQDGYWNCGIVFLIDQKMETRDLSFEKTVSGNMGDKYKEFEFKVSIANKYDVKLKSIGYANTSGTSGLNMSNGDYIIYGDKIIKPSSTVEGRADFGTYVKKNTQLLINYHTSLSSFDAVNIYKLKDATYFFADGTYTKIYLTPFNDQYRVFLDKEYDGHISSNDYVKATVGEVPDRSKVVGLSYDYEYEKTGLGVVKNIWYKYKLSHNDTVVIEDIPYGYEYEIVEKDYSNEGYKTMIDGELKREISNELTEDTHHTVENRNQVIVPTGVRIQQIGGIVCVVVIGVLVFFTKKRRKMYN